MKIVPTLLFSILLVISVGRLNAQTVCPVNIDFELGNTSGWSYYTGNCCPVAATTSGTPVIGRHTITSGSALDPFGGFPIVAPGSGAYSLKLGNAAHGAQSEKARYYVQVPTGLSNYCLFYRYAVVFEDPGHDPAEQPRFEVSVFDSATGAPVSCAQFVHISAPDLPGFHESPGNPGVYYKGWETGNINLSGYGGTTVAVDFATGDCGLGAHFGYGYIDMSCGLFAINTELCNADSLSLAAPAGFYAYAWYDSSSFTLLDTSRILSIVPPATTTTLAVVLYPYPGIGCIDTLYTVVHHSQLHLQSMRDTTICPSTGVLLSPHATDIMAPLSYSWSGGMGLSCATCASVLASPLTVTTYIVKVANATGCYLTDTVVVSPSLVSFALADTTLCDTNAVSLGGSASGLYPPFTYNWWPAAELSCANCPAVVAHNIASGEFVLSVRDATGCIVRDTATVVRGALVMQPLADIVLCPQRSVDLVPNLLASDYPVSYNWTSIASMACSTCKSVTVASTVPVIYTLSAVNAAGCSFNDTVIVKPVVLSVRMPADTLLCAGVELRMMPEVTATTPCSYQWLPDDNHEFMGAKDIIVVGDQTTTYRFTATDSLGCSISDTVRISRSSLELSLEGNTYICSGKSIALVRSVSDNSPVSFEWSPMETLSCSDCGNPVAAPGRTTTYRVTAIDDAGCTVTDSVTIKVDLCNIWFPSAFTPNGDGKNDKARVVGHLEYFKDFSLSIFNRFGQMVFNTTDVNDGWDGQFNGVRQELGVYYYMITFKINGSAEMLKGDITLVR